MSLTSSTWGFPALPWPSSPLQPSLGYVPAQVMLMDTELWSCPVPAQLYLHSPAWPSHAVSHSGATHQAQKKSTERFEVTLAVVSGAERGL